MNCYQYFYGWDIIASHLLPSLTTKFPPLITVCFAFVNMMDTLRNANHRFGIGDQWNRLIPSEIAGDRVIGKSEGLTGLSIAVL